MTKEKDIGVEYLRTRLRYEPETGKLFWLDNEDMPTCWRVKHAGKEALTAYSNGYRVGTILKKRRKAHRVAWALHYGEWPSDEIDHINGVKDDNRIENLRNVSRTENNQNHKKRSTNKSGVMGVERWEQTKKWRVRITVSGLRKHIGYFDCIGQAIKARLEAERLYGFHPNHGRR